MRILVTGGAGFIGSHYVRTMLAGGYPGYEHAAAADRKGHDRRYRAAAAAPAVTGGMP